MSATQTRRTDFTLRLARLLPDLNPTRLADLARSLMRMSATHCRLQEAQCSGYYPADNGERPVIPCPQCANAWARESFRLGVCPDCRIEARITAALAQHGLEPIFHGDPRGCTVRIKCPRELADDGSGEGLCVPQ